MASKKGLRQKEKMQGYVTALAEHLEARYAARNDYLALLRQHRYLRAPVNIPDVYKKTAAEYRAADILDVLRKSVAMVGTQMPQPKVIPLRPESDASQRNSSEKEAWHRAAFVEMDKGKSVYLKTVDGAMEAAAVIQQGMNRHKWGGYVEGEGDDATWKHIAKGEKEDTKDYLARVEDHHKKNFPFWWQAVPIDTFYPSYDADGKLVEVVIKGKRLAYPLAEQFDKTPWAKKWKAQGERRVGSVSTDSDISSDEVEFIEYWNATCMMRVIENEVVEYEAHEYKRPPFWEIRSAITTSTNVVDEVMGLAAPLLDIERLKNSLMTMKLNYAYLTMFVTYKLVPQNTEFVGGTPEGEKDRIITVEVGKVVEPPPGYDLVPIAMPPTGPDGNQTLEYLEAKGKELGLASVLNGEMPRGDTSGPAMVTQINIAKSIFGTIVGNLTKAFNEMAAWQEEMVETVIREPVPVWYSPGKNAPKNYPQGWIKIGPKDIDGYYQVEHTMKHVLPAERIQWTAFLAQTRNMGIKIPGRRVLEDGLGIEDPETWEDEYDVERLEEDPAIDARIKERALALVGAKGQKPGTPPALAGGLSGPLLSPTPIQQPQQQVAPVNAPAMPQGNGQGGMMP